MRTNLIYHSAYRRQILKQRQRKLGGSPPISFGVRGLITYELPEQIDTELLAYRSIAGSINSGMEKSNECRTLSIHGEISCSAKCLLSYEIRDEGGCGRATNSERREARR